MKLNLGCGFRKKDGFVNVDISAGCKPDLVLNLAKERWPWQDHSVQEVHFDFSLEEMGDVKTDLLHVIQELYRVCATEADVKIRFLHPRHDQFELNPLCVHRLSAEFFNLLSLSGNLQRIAEGTFETCLAMSLGVNFNVVRHKYLISRIFEQGLESGAITEDQLRTRMSFDNNICHAMEVDLKALKN